MNEKMCASGVLVIGMTSAALASPHLSPNANPPARADPPAPSVVASVVSPTEGPTSQTITQSLSQDITPGASVSCNAGGLHEDNSYFRVFDLAQFGIQFDFQVQSVEIGVEIADSPVGVQPIIVRLYDSANLQSLPPPVGLDIENVATQSLTYFSFDVVGLVRSGFLTVEIFTPSGIADGNSFFIGANALGQTGPSFIMAPACGVNTPTDLADIGFPDVHIVMNVTGQELVPSGDFAVDTTPDVLGFTGAGALSGEPTPRAHRVANQDDLIDAVVRVRNISPTDAAGVTATLTPPPGSGIIVLNNPVSFGDIASGVASPGVFHIETTGAPVALHQMELAIASSLGQEADPIWLPVWSVELFNLDPGIGHGDVVVVTPMSTDTISMVMPEVFDINGVPVWFDLQSLSDERTFTEPFFGAHWGEAAKEPPTLMPPTPSSQTEQTGTFNLHGVVKTKSGAPVPGVTVKLRGAVNPTVTTTSDANGQYWFMNVPKGSYTFHIDPPVVLRRFYRPSWDNNATQFGSGVFTDSWTYPDIPPNSGTSSTTSNSGGSTPPPTTSGGGKTAKSIGVGVASGGLAAAFDLLGAPKTWGITLASLGLSAVAGGVADYATDPIETDIFYFAEEMTIPASPMELTLSESISMSFTITPPPPGGLNVTIVSTWDFTRTTDAAVYTASGAESFDAPILLQMIGPIAQRTSDGQSVIVSIIVLLPSGEPLVGGEALVTAYLGRFNDPVGLGMDVLHDDGQAPDAVAGDGRFSASLPIPPGEQQGPPMDVFFWAERTGSAEHLIPPLIGLVEAAVTAFCPADLNGDGVVNGADLASLLTQWGTNGPADLNGDGVVDGADLASLLTNWGPCS